MENKPSIIVPSKRLRNCLDKSHNSSVKKIFINKNHSKNVSENDLQALVDFAICNPGEYASLGY